MKGVIRPSTLLKKILQNTCFTVNIVKFLKTPILKNISEQLLLILSSPSSEKCLSLKKCIYCEVLKKSVRTIISLLFCYNIAIIRIIVELYQKLNMCNETFIDEDLTRCREKLKIATAEQLSDPYTLKGKWMNDISNIPEITWTDVI